MMLSVAPVLDHESDFTLRGEDVAIQELGEECATEVLVMRWLAEFDLHEFNALLLRPLLQHSADASGSLSRRRRCGASHT